MLGRVCTPPPTRWPGMWAQPSPVSVQGTAGYQTCSSFSFKATPPHLLLPAASWLNILCVYRNSRLTHNSPAGCSCRERSWQFLPSLTQPQAPAHLCLHWGAGSGTPVGGGWEHPSLFPLGRWSSRAPLPQAQIYSCFSSPMGKGCSLLIPNCFLALLAGQQAGCVLEGVGMGLRLGFWGVFLLFVAGGWNPSVIPPGRDRNIWRAAGEL